MKTIRIYSAKPQSNDGSATKGTSSNPYTQEEYNGMLDAGTWNGGYVEGLGYVLPEVEVYGSSSKFSESDSDSWNDPWSNTSDPWSDISDQWETPGESSHSQPSGGSGTGSNNGGTQGGGGVNTKPNRYNISDAVDYLVSHAYPSYNDNCGHCARAVRRALEAGGLSTTGHPVSACDYDTFLPKIGFHSVDKNGYSPEKGDIIVLEAVEGHPNGHIAMYSGNYWISDFVQSDMWGGSAFRNNAEYTLFRR